MTFATTLLLASMASLFVPAAASGAEARRIDVGSGTQPPAMSTVRRSAPGAARTVNDLQELLGADGLADRRVVRGRALFDAALLRTFYQARGFEPLWIPSGAPVRTGQPRDPRVDLDAFLQALEDARLHGLQPDAYHADLLQVLRADAAAAAELELLATDGFLRHALHRAHGRLRPADVDPEWHLFETEADPATLLDRLAAGVPPAFLLDDLWPRVPEYWALLEEKRQIAARRSTLPVPVSPGPLLRLGDRNSRVLELRARLGVTPLDDDRFDAALDSAVREFQSDQGLVVDGVVGRNTLELLNLTDAQRVARIEVNLERWRWLMRSLPGTRIQVNVAEYGLQTFEADREVLRMNVIVGTPFRRTPVFTEPMRYLVFNPYWNVPRRIAVQDKLPLLKADPASLAASGYQARYAQVDAPVLPVDAIDWSSVTAGTFNYLLRQRPGDDNALGRVKFILPNPYQVYLHDTPARELFARSGRAFSSGCIRLEHAMQLAQWVLRDQPEWTRERIDAVLAAGEPVEVPLRERIPVLVLYFTVAVTESGAVVYRPDLYGRDQAVADALAAGSAGGHR